MKTISELPNRSNFDDDGKVAVDDTLQSYYCTGTQVRDYIAPLSRFQSQLLKNIGLSVTDSSGDMIVALKQNDGSTNPTTGRDQSEVSFRNTDPTLGGYINVPFTASLSLTIPSGATLNYANGVDARVYIYVYYDGTNKGLFVSSTLLDEKLIHDIIAIDATADDGDNYGDANRTDAAIRLIGEFVVEAIATAGTWTAPDLVAIQQFQRQVSGASSGAKQVEIGGNVTSDTTINITTFTPFPTNPNITFVAAETARYLVWVNITAYALPSDGMHFRIAATTGSPSVVLQDATEADSTGVRVPVYVFGIFDLVAGTTYTFELQGRCATGGSNAVTLNCGSRDNGVNVVAQQIS